MALWSGRSEGRSRNGNLQMVDMEWRISSAEDASKELPMDFKLPRYDSLTRDVGPGLYINTGDVH